MTHKDANTSSIGAGLSLFGSRLLAACLLSVTLTAGALAGPPEQRAYPHPAYLPHQRKPVAPVSPVWKEQVARHQQAALPLPVFVKVLGPAQTKVVFFAADASEHVRPSPVMAGLRSRHRYAFAIENTPYTPERRFYGTIEVLNGPRLPEGVAGTEHPIPINFTEEDCTALSRNQMLTKIIVLEDPEFALSAPVGVDETIRYDSTLSPDAIAMAKELGKLVLVVRIGDRVPTKDELVGSVVAGSLILPKVDKPGSYVFVDNIDREILLTALHGKTRQISHPPAAVAPEQCGPAGCLPVDRFPSETYGPACPPGVAFPGWPYVDRFYGEYLCDGGDLGPKAGRNEFNVLVNVNPSDTVAEYRDNYNKHRIVESNRVCVYSPRYVEVRTVQMVEGFEVHHLPEFVARDRSMDAFVNAVAGIEAVHEAQPQNIRMRQRASSYVHEQWISGFTEVRVLEGVDNSVGFGVEGTMVGPFIATAIDQAVLAKQVLFAEQMTRFQYPVILARLEGLGQLITTWKEQELVHVEEKQRLARLKIEKSASVAEAKIGETVTFQITYTNIGDAPLSNVAVVDSLLARLEYVENSAQSSRDAIFTAEENDVGSHILRWEIKEPLAKGESGTVSFQVRIR